MDQKLTNITHPKFRCSLGGCHAVYKSEDGKTFRITGELYNPDGCLGLPPGIEADVDISADLLLSSLGIADLIEAAKQAEMQLANFEAMCRGTDRTQHAAELAETLRALRDVLTRIQGGDGNG